MIYFIGAGPGDPDLITLKAQKILQRADAVLYTGSLVPRDVLGWCREDALIVDSQGMKYPEIFAFLEAHSDKVLARVHTGDPSLYSTLARQVDFLNRKGIAYEVIPGVTAAFGAAASLGIEYTVPGVSQTMILTRVEGNTPNPEPLKNILTCRHSSLVFYLSIALLPTLKQEALAMGYDPHTPCWVVEKATWEAEAIYKGTLESIEEQVAHIRGVALILLGDFLKQQESEASHLYVKPLRKEGVQ
jgi:precorrin-4/cobalt-precorrin-4 C11-methyltransferase